jgi:catechol 2,3-dioxygenase-like lactoylglutathione lyase family enzyme
MDPLTVLGVDHVDLTVTDRDRSAALYGTVLGALGFRVIPQGHDDDAYVVYANAHMAVGLRPATEANLYGTFDRTRVGLHHLAFRALSRADVDRFHGFLVAQHLPVLDRPAEYPQYGEGYYAVFFSDPDGMKLELAQFPWGHRKKVMTEGADERPRHAKRG